MVLNQSGVCVVSILVYFIKTRGTFIQYTEKLHTINTRKESQFFHGTKPNINWFFATSFKTGQEVWQCAVTWCGMIHLDVVNRLVWDFQEPITAQNNTANIKEEEIIKFCCGPLQCLIIYYSEFLFSSRYLMSYLFPLFSLLSRLIANMKAQGWGDKFPSLDLYFSLYSLLS